MNRIASSRQKWTSFLSIALCLVAIAGCSHSTPEQVDGGNLEHGKATVEHYGCVACHAIAGISKPSGNVAPSRDKIAMRAYIAGILVNTPDNIGRWRLNPPATDSLIAMPNLGIPEA